MARIRKRKRVASARPTSKRSREAKRRTPKAPNAIVRNLRPIVPLFSILILMTSFGYGVFWVVQNDYVTQLSTAGEDWWIDQTAALGFRLEHIEISGNTRTPDKVLEDTLSLQPGDPLLALPLEQLRQDVTALPWVAHVAISRHLPDKLFIQIKERTPSALWQQGGEVHLIDRAGKVISVPDPGEFADLMLVVGPEANEEALTFLAMLSTIPELESKVVAGIRVGQRRWNLLMDNGIFVNLPEESPHQAYHKLADLQDQHKILHKDVRVIDMRLSDRLILQMSEGQKASSNPFRR